MNRRTNIVIIAIGHCSVKISIITGMFQKPCSMRLIKKIATDITCGMINLTATDK